MTTRQALEKLADTIDSTLHSLGVSARITSGSVLPWSIVFYATDQMPVAPLQTIGRVLASTLGRPVWVYRQDRTLVVLVIRNDSTPVRLIPLLKGLENVPPLTAVLGHENDGTPLLMHLPSTPRVVVSSESGGGKTSLLRTIVLSLVYLHTFASRGAGLNLAIITDKPREFGVISALPHVRTCRPGDVPGDANVVVIDNLDKCSVGIANTPQYFIVTTTLTPSQPPSLLISRSPDMPKGIWRAQANNNDTALFYAAYASSADVARVVAEICQNSRTSLPPGPVTSSAR